MSHRCTTLLRTCTRGSSAPHLPIPHLYLFSHRHYSHQQDNKDNPAPQESTHRTIKSTKFGIHNQFASKIPKYQARLEKTSDEKEYWGSGRVLGFFKVIYRYFRDNPVPKDIPRREQLRFVLHKYFWIYTFLLGFWSVSYLLWKYMRSTKIDVVGYGDWHEVVEGLYVRRVNVRINSRTPMSSNACVVRMSNGDLLYYNALPPSPDTLAFLKRLLRGDHVKVREDGIVEGCIEDVEGSAIDSTTTFASQEEATTAINSSANLAPTRTPAQHTIHIIVPNDLTINFAPDYFPFSQDSTLPLKFYVHEKNTHFHSLLDKWLSVTHLPVSAQVVTQPQDFPQCITNDFDVEIVNELKNLHEIVLHHRASRMAIMCDITQNVVAGKSLPTDFTGYRLVEKYMEFQGKIGKFGTVNPKLIETNDSQALLAKMQAIANWNFQGLVMARGEVLRPGEMDGVHVAFLKRWMGALAQKVAKKERLQEARQGVKVA